MKNIIIYTILWVFLVIMGVFVITNAKAAPSKFDGQWTLTIHKDCDKSDAVMIINVKDGKLASSQIFLDIDGKIGDNGSLTIVASYNGTTLYSKGVLSSKEGSGDWQTSNPTQSCSGKWKAIKGK